MRTHARPQYGMNTRMSRLLTPLLLIAALAFAPRPALAQSLPVSVDVSGNTASVRIGLGSHPVADLTLTFDDASGLSASSLGISADLVSTSNPALLARLPDAGLNQLAPSFPLLITIEPPASGGLSFHRTVRVEVHTHALSYSAGSDYRLLKAPIGGQFRDITDEIAPGSIRARGTTGGFSQFLVLSDVRPTSDVIAAKMAWMRARVDELAAAEQPAFDAYLDSVQSDVASGDYAGALAALDLLRQRAGDRAGQQLQDQWRATHDTVNQAGELIAGAATLKFSIGYLRDYGQ